MPNSEQRTIQLRVECIDLPRHDWGGHTEIWLGIQLGKEVVQEVKLPVETAVFNAELRVPGDSSQERPNFLGPYAQGSAHDRFVYLCWGSRQAGLWTGFRRAKIPLTGLTWEDLKSHRLLVKVRCTDAKGGPACATLRGSSVSWSG